MKLHKKSVQLPVLPAVLGALLAAGVGAALIAVRNKSRQHVDAQGKEIKLSGNLPENRKAEEFNTLEDVAPPDEQEEGIGSCD